ncbi:hypothetical protein F4804DRAFT_309629, partial [Jackrogersella minutella]
MGLLLSVTIALLLSVSSARFFLDSGNTSVNANESGVYQMNKRTILRHSSRHVFEDMSYIPIDELAYADVAPIIYGQFDSLAQRTLIFQKQEQKVND